MNARRLRDLKLCGLALVLMAPFAWVQVIAIDVPWLRRIELAALDAQIRMRGPQRPGPETVIVLIDDQTIADLGRWPVPRRAMAELVTVLRRAGAKAIGVDVLFAEPDQGAAGSIASARSGGDLELAKAIEEAGNVAVPFTFRFGGHRADAAKPSLTSAAYVTLRKDRTYHPVALAPTGAILPYQAIAAVATLGHMLVAYDVDGAPRYDYPVLEFDLDYYPSMAIRIAQLYLGEPWQEVRVELGRGVALGHVYVPTDSQMRMLVNYLGPARTFPTYRFSEALSGAVPGSTFRDRIVLVGANALGTRDTFESPFTAVMPGLERLATVIDSILHERHLGRPRTAPWLEVGLMLASAVAIGFAMSRLSLAAAFVCTLALVAIIASSGYIALKQFGLWQTSAVPIGAIILTFTALSLYRYGLLDKERRHMRRVFQRYLAPNMVDRVVTNDKLPELGGEQRELTILFCDLRGFTALSERLAPAVLTRVANQFFALATEAILEHRGTVDKYLGDAIMAFWNAPADQPDHPALACRAALRILEKVDRFNELAALTDGLPRLEIGVGINTGVCTVGNFGSPGRFDYSAIGDAVNVAARLEGETRAYGVATLLGPETAARVADFATLPVDRIRPRGRIEELEVFTLVGDEQVAATPWFRELRSLHLGLRAAEAVRDAEAVRRLLDELKQRAPATLHSLYDVLVSRAAEGPVSAQARSGHAVMPRRR